MSLVISGLIGLVAGLLSGVYGIGGGVIVVPGLLVLVGLTQREATGTSLAALLLPVGLLGVLTYSRLGAVKLPIALLLALGMLAGTYLGSRLALSLPEVTLRRGLALLLVLVAGQLILKK